jgi:hypothetical protein
VGGGERELTGVGTATELSITAEVGTAADVQAGSVLWCDAISEREAVVREVGRREKCEMVGEWEMGIV